MDKKDRFTEKGLKDIKNRMNSFIDLFNNHKFPFQAQMLGFGKFRIESKEECLIRIKELSHLTGVEFNIITEVNKGLDSKTEVKKIEVKNG